MFACEHEGVSPDLMCVAKGLTGGYLPLAATLATEDVYSAFLGEYGELKTFFHGHSYTGNQLACAAALASLDIFEKDRVIEGLAAKIDLVQERLEETAALPHVGEVRQCGLMVGIELEQAPGVPYPFEQAMGARVCRRARAMGLITRPLGSVIVFLPPLASTVSDLECHAGDYPRRHLSGDDGVGSVTDLDDALRADLDALDRRDLRRRLRRLDGRDGARAVLG